MQLLVLFDLEHAIANSLHILMPFHCFLLQIELLPLTTKPLLLPKSHFQSYTPQQILFSLAVWIVCAGIWGSDSSIEVSDTNDFQCNHSAIKKTVHVRTKYQKRSIKIYFLFIQVHPTLDISANIHTHINT
jgi:hypothetical protein